jgi:hypothetical protein
MHFSENKIGWQLVHENGSCSLFPYNGLMNLSENIIGCQQGNSSMKIYIGMELVKSLVFLKDLYKGF